MKRGLALSFLILVLAWTPRAAWSQMESAIVEPEAAPIVDDVRLEGLQRIEEDTARLNIGQGVGSPLDRREIAEDIRRLYDLGYFSDVRVVTEARPDDRVVLTYQFTERPLIRSVDFSGNREIDNDKIQEVIDIRRRTMLDENRLRQVAERISAKYAERGFTFTQVFPELEELPQNEVRVHFRIEENLKVRVGRVNLVGNHVFDDATLRGLLETRADHVLSFLTSSGVFKEGNLARDVDAIANHYLNNGYINVRIATPKAYLSADRKVVDVTFEIEEGEQYFVGTVEFGGDIIFDRTQMGERLRTQTELPFSRERLARDVQRVSEQYQDIGFAFVTVNPLTDIDEEARIVNLNFDVDKGELVYINQIRMRGNTKTRDKVIRRELLVVEGQLFDGGRLRRSRERVYALGFFEEVNFRTEPAGEDLMDIIIDVSERSTGTLSAGIGFNSLDRFLGIGQVSFGNLLGYGIRLNAQAEFGGSRQFYTLSYTDPYFLDTRWSLGGDLFNNRREYPEYTQQSIGGSLNAGYLIALNTRLYANYRYEDISLGNFIGGGTDFFRGTATGSLGASLIRDTRNHPFDPSDGYRLTAGVQWANPVFGGENAFMKYRLDGIWFQHLFRGVVFSTHAEVAWGHDTRGGRLPFTERYFLGGISSLRGYFHRQVGPRTTIPGASTSDFFQPVDVVFGGNKMLVSHNEITFPILPEAGIKGVVFFDAGNAYAEEQPFFDEGLRMGVGYGIRWFSPIGPLRFEWGYPINRRPEERPSVFEFSIGTFF